VDPLPHSNLGVGSQLLLHIVAKRDYAVQFAAQISV
jgi:hypothetical protein